VIPASEQYPYISLNPAAGPIGLLPYLPSTRTLQKQSVPVLGFLDTAATVNVLPNDIGLQLGAVWSQQTTVVQLTGNLASVTARGLVVRATVGQFPPIVLAFAWAQANTVPLLLGEVNFFMDFDAYFSRSRGIFEVKPK
jgi:hypothetical protein